MIRQPVRMAYKHRVTGKPTAVMQRLVRIAHRKAALDPLAGSGTTGVAALVEGQTFLGVEVAGEYARIAGDRLGATRSELGVRVPARYAQMLLPGEWRPRSDRVRRTAAGRQ